MDESDAQEVGVRVWSMGGGMTVRSSATSLNSSMADSNVERMRKVLEGYGGIL